MKEPDCSWGPSTVGMAQMSLVIEIGLSESQGELATVAHHWLKAAGSTVKSIITILVS